MGVTFLEQLTKMRPNCARAWTWHNQLAPANNEQHSTAHALCPPLCSCYITEKISGTFRAPTGFSMKRRTKARTQASTSILLGLQSCHKWAMQTFLYYRPSSSAIIRLLGKPNSNLGSLTVTFYLLLFLNYILFNIFI
jgi:hypothetical protein